MTFQPLYKYFIYNDRLKPVSSFIPSENKGGVYEVLRVVGGIPLFLEDHLLRFYHSAELAGKTVRLPAGQIEGLLKKLITENKISEGNVLVSCKTNLNACFIPHNYPSDEMYENGVDCGILNAERENPNAKVFLTSVRELANQMIFQNGYYEVVLVDHLGRITEGSRSNIFFVKENTLITPPGNEVLLGITRQKIFMLAKSLKINLREEDIFLSRLPGYEAAAITGTSPKILPLRKIGNCSFNPQNKVIQQLIHGYNKLIEDYIQIN